jgi:hypothetical protein
VPIWKEHPKADIAVMYVSLPKEADIQLLPMTLLATDKELEEYEIHPGDALSCLASISTVLEMTNVPGTHPLVDLAPSR